MNVCALPVSEDVQHSFCGGEGAIGGEEDSDEGRVAHGKGVKEVEHQLLFCSCLNTLGASHRRLQGAQEGNSQEVHICEYLGIFPVLLTVCLTVGPPCGCLTTTV